MALAKPFSVFPFPLGVVAPPSAGTPLRITNNFTDLNTEAVASLWVWALASNTSHVYLLSQATATGKDLTGYTNVIADLAPGQGIPLAGLYGNQIVLGNIWVDPAVSGEGIASSILEN